MARKKRKKSETDFYHVIVKGINNEKIFNQQREKLYFKSKILKHLSKYPVEIYSYCIMSTHAHFIIRAELKILSAYMSVVLSEYAIYYNYKHGRNGHVFQNRFMSECIETEKYFWSCLRYIHLNPVKANMIKQVEKFKYSSMKEYITGIPEVISQRAIGLMEQYFGEIEKFVEFHRSYSEEVFCDVSNDIAIQEEEIAYLLMRKLQERYKLPMLCQVMEEKEIRKVLEEQICKKLKISKKRCKKLCCIVKDKRNLIN